MVNLLKTLLEERLVQDQALEEEQKKAFADAVGELDQAEMLAQDAQNELIVELAQDTLDEYEDEDELTPGRQKFLESLVDGAVLSEEQKRLFLDVLTGVEEEQERIGALEGKRNADFPVKPGVDPTKLDQAGWAIVFPARMKNRPLPK